MAADGSEMGTEQVGGGYEGQVGCCMAGGRRRGRITCGLGAVVVVVVVAAATAAAGAGAGTGGTGVLVVRSLVTGCIRRPVC